MTDTTSATARAMPRARRRKGVPADAPGMRAAIYIRLSRETDETTSPERQRAACEALCEARGWDVIFVEEDIDVSGFSRGLDRPGLQRILTRLAELDVIVFFKIDRLARSTVDFAEIMRLAEHQSVALASATEPLDLTSSMGRAMAKVIAVFAELESDTIGMRVSSRMSICVARVATPAVGSRTGTWSSPTPTGRARSLRSTRTRPRRSSGSWSGF
ncbi:recombinase family protein [Streptomyces sp. NPDC005820]|uniref:recombinase family protein n=1 Tax=Streptomyces sp. NPDC005820 TaxID=3157069 RepID=UPI0033E78EE9